ncbi:MAG: hypothetical protein HY064_10520 [Bacteroidetes bacterium]|nr:hypothetical protein [Bacteroidota bacterium]
MKSKKFSLFIAMIVMVFSCKISFAQLSDTHSYTAISTGIYLPNLATLNSVPSGTYKLGGFSNPLGIGIDRGATAKSEKLNHAAVTLLSFQYLLPQTISNDSVSFKLNGYHVLLDIVGFNFLKSDNAVFTGGIAWCFGRFKVTENQKGNVSTFLDPYFDPVLRLQLHVRLGDHFYIGARAGYQYDGFFNSAWKKSGSTSDVFPALDMSGVNSSFFIGFGK